MMTATRKFRVIGYCSQMKPRRAQRGGPRDRLSMFQRKSPRDIKSILLSDRTALLFFSFFLGSHSSAITPWCTRWNLLVNCPLPYCQRRCLNHAGKVFPISVTSILLHVCMYAESMQDHSIRSLIYLFAKAAINIVFPDTGERERKRNRCNEIEIHNRIIIMFDKKDDCPWCTFHCQGILVFAL